MLLQLAEELQTRGYGICPVLPAKGLGWLAKECTKRGFQPEAFSLRRPLDWRCLQGLIDVLRRREVDLVHSHEFTMAFYGAAASRWLHKPHVITMHGGQRVLSHWRRRLAFRWSMRQSRAVAAVSGYFAITTFIKMIGRVGLLPFALYCIGFGGLAYFLV